MEGSEHNGSGVEFDCSLAGSTRPAEAPRDTPTETYQYTHTHTQ